MYKIARVQDYPGWYRQLGPRPWSGFFQSLLQTDRQIFNTVYEWVWIFFPLKFSTSLLAMSEYNPLG